MDIIILAMVAGFVLLRLYNVLGRRTGNEQRPDKPYGVDEATPLRPERPRYDPANDANNANQNAEVIDLYPSSEESRILAPVMAVDRRFDAAGFVQGARGAYEMIIEAFATGDRDTLEPLLGDAVRDNFIAAIDEREQAGETMETKVVDILSADIVDAGVENKIADVTVRFHAEVISVVRDSEGRIIDGNPSDVDVIDDVWTFARDTKNRDPNWLLVATQRGE